MNELEKCIRFYTEALDLFPVGHPDRAASLHSLAWALQCRYDRPHSLDDLEKCIRPYTEALELHSAGHPESVSALHNLAWALRRRYVRFRSLSDLEASIQLYTEASELRPADHLGIMALHMHMLLTCYVIDHVPWMTSRGAFDFIPRRWNFTLTTIRTVACVEKT